MSEQTTNTVDAGKQSGRMIEQDIAKGVAIFLVILFHTLTMEKSFFYILGGLFGFIMPFFFFIAGYNHKPYRYTYKQIIALRSKQILVPLIVYTFVINAIGGVYFMITRGYTLRMVAENYLVMLLTRPFASKVGLQMANGLFSCIMVSWFIIMLFTASLIFYAVVDYALAKASRLISVTIGLLMISMVCAHFDLCLPFHICEAPCVAAIMLLGAFFGQKKLLSDQYSRRSIVINSIVSYSLFLLLAAMFKGAGLIMGGNLWNDTLKEWSVLLTAAFAIVGTYPFVHACRCLRNTGILARSLIWCGSHSMQLLLIHGIVQLFLCEILGMEPFRMSAMSEVTDLRTIYLLALEMAVSVLIILGIEYIQKRIKKTNKDQVR